MAEDTAPRPESRRAVSGWFLMNGFVTASWVAHVPRLSAAPVRALDVRAGAALVLAGLAADGETVVLDPFHVDRGYSDLAGSLRALGADVERVHDWR